MDESESSMEFVLCFLVLSSYNFHYRIGGEKGMRCRGWFPVVMVSVVAILLGRVEFSFSKDRPHEFTMENGIKAILEVNRATHVVALQVWVKVGSGDERVEKVTKEDVNQVARKYFDLESYAIAIVRPPVGKRE